MRALSVKQPWAYAITLGFKPIENRSKPNHAIRGWVLIHATFPSKAYLTSAMAQIRAISNGPEALAAMPRTILHGHIIGAAKIGLTVQNDPSPWFFGPYGYRVLDAVSFEPRPEFRVPGALGFWKANSDAKKAAFAVARDLMTNLRPGAEWAE